MLCFALLAHKDEAALFQQIRNIRKYNGRKAKIVLYNGSSNPDFGKRVCRKEDVMYCPYSSPLRWGRTGRFFYDIMRWLEEEKVSYDYLVYMEHDVFFINQGLERFLEEELKGFDFIGKVIRKLDDPKRTTWKPGMSLWREWSRWKPFFKSDHFYGTFNPMQVYRHSIIKRMLARINRRQLELLFYKTRSFALGEMLYITLAALSGGKGKSYPRTTNKYLRLRRIQLDDTKKAKSTPGVMFVHPVKKEEVRNWICK